MSPLRRCASTSRTCRPVGNGTAPGTAVRALGQTDQDASGQRNGSREGSNETPGQGSVLVDRCRIGSLTTPPTSNLPIHHAISRR